MALKSDYRVIQYFLLICFIGIQFTADLAFAHYDYPIAYSENFRQLRRDEYYGLPLLRQIIYYFVHFLFGSDIYSACGLVKNQYITIDVEPLPHNAFLLIAPAQ